jgi:plasmid stabilization system protein ParE
MRIRWSPAATADFEHISDYLKDHQPHYRQPTLRKLYDTIRALKQWPGRGRLASKTTPSMACASVHRPRPPLIALHKARCQRPYYHLLTTRHSLYDTMPLRTA